MSLSTGAECYTGASLHRQFGFPFEIDKRITEAAFPWLKDYIQPGCPLPPRDVEPNPAVAAAGGSAPLIYIKRN